MLFKWLIQRTGGSLAVLLTALLALPVAAQSSTPPPPKSPEVAEAEFRQTVTELVAEAKRVVDAELAKQQAKAQASSYTVGLLQQAATALNGGSAVAAVQWVSINTKKGHARIEAICPNPLPATPVIHAIHFTRYSAEVLLCGLELNPVISEFTRSRFWLFEEVAQDGRRDLIRVAGCKYWNGKRAAVKFRHCRYPKTAMIFFDGSSTSMYFTCRSLRGLRSIQVNETNNWVQETSCAKGGWVPRLPPPPPAPPA